MPDYQKLLDEHNNVMRSLGELLPEIDRAAQVIVHAIKGGRKLMLCGNGGSAADAQHIAAEIIGRFESDRQGLGAIALTTDTSILTAVANDFGYTQIFRRQLQSLAHRGDVLLAYSTSGDSVNVIEAADEARSLGCFIVSMTGNGGGKLALMSDVNLCVASSITARIQEAHAFMGHAICAALDEAFNG